MDATLVVQLHIPRAKKTILSVYGEILFIVRGRELVLLVVPMVAATAMRIERRKTMERRK